MTISPFSGRKMLTRHKKLCAAASGPGFLNDATRQLRGFSVPKNPLAGEAGTRDDARAHLMHELKHLIVVIPGVILDPVKCQRMRCAAAALIQRRDKAGLVLHLLHLLG